MEGLQLWVLRGYGGAGFCLDIPAPLIPRAPWLSSGTLNPLPAIIQLGGDRKGKPNVPNAEEKSRLGDFSPAGINRLGLCRSVSPGDGA